MVKALKPICDEKGVPFFVYRGSKLAKDEMVKQYSASKDGVMIITKAASEGISFKGVRNMIVYDPTFTDSQMKQIVGRAIRTHSHTHLPKDEQHVDVYYLVLIEEKYYNSYIQRMNDFKDTLYDLKAEMPMMPFTGKGTDDTQWTNSKSGDVKVFNIVLTKEWINYRVEKYIQKDQKYGLKKGFEDTDIVNNMTDAFAQMEKYMPPDQGNVRDVDTEYISRLEMYKSFLEVDSHIDYKNRSYSKADMKEIRKLYNVSLKNDLYETPSVYADFIYNEIVSQTEEDKTYDILEPSCGLCALAIPYLFHKNYNLTLNDIAPDVIKTIKPLNKIQGVKVVESDFLEDNKIAKKFDYIIMNPPFAGKYKGRHFDNYYALFIAKAMTMLKPKGRLYLICPLSSSTFDRVGSDPNNMMYAFKPSAALEKKLGFNYPETYFKDLGGVFGFRKIDPKTGKPKTIQIAINMFVNVVDDKRIRTLGDIEKKQEEARLLKQGDQR
eukprot:gene2450-7379_t